MLIRMITGRAVFPAIILGLAVAVACQNSQDSDDERSDAPPAVSGELLPGDAEGAGDQGLVGGHDVRLEAYLWRDFMPGPDMPPDGRPLRGVVRLRAVDSDSISGALDITYVWLKQGDVVWGAALTGPPSSEPPSTIEKGFADGPMWTPETTADVIVKVVDAGGVTAYFRVPDQLIEKTY
ncbi:MAG: hypothetical protein RBT76_14585 [candidate division Zixibacteria bacterium]|jgi:hypothetical protein|nr:hypothetical protein [candidate division Zixibacteria bacterium]